MYEAFYSLTKAPFSKESNGSSFVSRSFSEALARLEYLKRSRGMGLLVGEPGAGKTFVLKAFADSLNPALYKPVYFPLSTGTVMDFYRVWCRASEEPVSVKLSFSVSCSKGCHRING